MSTWWVLESPGRWASKYTMGCCLIRLIEVGGWPHCGWHHSLAKVLDYQAEYIYCSLITDCGCNVSRWFKLLPSNCEPEEGPSHLRCFCHGFYHSNRKSNQGRNLVTKSRAAAVIDVSSTLMLWDWAVHWCLEWAYRRTMKVELWTNKDLQY